MFSITDDKKAVEAINAILNNRGIAEIKIERDRESGRNRITVVEIRRTVKTN